MVRYILSLLLLAPIAFPQTFEVKDRNGIPVVAVNDVKLFRYSDYFKEEIPDFRGFIKNVSGERLLGVSISGIVHKKDGAVVRFKLDSVCGQAIAPCDFSEDFASEAIVSFLQPWPFKSEDVDSLEFILDKAQRLTTKDGFHVSGFIAKDEGCFNDYLATKSLTGVALRKKLVELIEYGCGFVVEKPQEVLVLNMTKKMLGVGAKKVAAVQVVLSGAEATLLGYDAPHDSDIGWILVSALVPGPVLTTEEIGVAK